AVGGTPIRCANASRCGKNARALDSEEIDVWRLHLGQVTWEVFVKLTSAVAFISLMCISCSSSPPMRQTPLTQEVPLPNKHVVTITEFQGDRLGDSIETFKARHPGTRCKPFKFGKDLTEACVVSGLVDVAGVPLEFETQDCDSPKPVNCYQYMSGIFNPNLEV